MPGPIVPVPMIATRLYVLIPVLDDQKHYWVSAPEIEKLLKRGEGWLPAHPEREEFMTWVPADFDPSAFDADEVDARLRSL